MTATDAAALGNKCPVLTCRAAPGVWCGSGYLGPWMHERRYLMSEKEREMSFADTNDYGYTDKEPTQAAPPSKGEQLGRLINEKVKDPFHDGDVVKFVVLARYEYHYAALRAGGKWYPTGSSSLVPSGPLTYRRFVEEVLNREDVTGIEISTGWEPVQ